MIVIRCQNCRARVQVPSPGTYRCHNCREIIEVQAENAADINSEAMTVKIEDQEDNAAANHKVKARSDSPPSAFCRKHPGKKAVRTCRKCGDLICEDCSVRLENNFYCTECIRKIQENVSGQAFGDDKNPPIGESSIPLENAEKDGYIQSFFNTIKKIFLDYARFYDNTGKNSHLRRAAVYGIIITFIYDFARFLAVNYFGLATDKASGDLPPILQEIYNSYTAPTIRSVILSPLASIFGLVILSAIYHAAILIMKGGGKYSTTFKITCYSNSAQIISIILIPVPLLGTLISFIFGIIFITQGCIKLHNLAEGKSIFVALFPTILAVGLIFLAMMSLKM
jgi:hypothetical protein